MDTQTSSIHFVIMTDFKNLLLTTKHDIDNALRTSFLSPSNTLEKTSEAMNYAVNIGDGGKRIRPAIVMAVNEIFNGNKKTAHDFAKAVELIHTYTLIIDDIQDQGELRRGLPCCHIKYGVNTAILAASRLFEKGLAPFHKSASDKFTLLNDQLHQGQAADLNTNQWTKEQLTLNDLQFIHAGKTSSLIQMSILGGCIAAGLKEEQSEKLLRYGYYLGLAFQAKDDILSKLSSAEESGKLSVENKVGFSDFFENIETAIHEAQQLSKKAKDELLSFDQNGIPLLMEIADYAVNRKK